MHAADSGRGLTAARLRELLSYDRLTGVFRRAVSPCNSIKVNEVAGTVSKKDGYVRISVDGNRYLAHRLAWLYVTGEWPMVMLDHKDRDKSNNAIRNLRAATNQENCRNSVVRTDNLLGIKGVRLHEGGRYQSRIYYGERFHSLGLFDTAADAAEAYAKAAAEHFGEFARAA